MGNQRWFRWGQVRQRPICGDEYRSFSTCIESNFGIVWFKGKSVRMSLKCILIRPSTNTTLPPIFWPSPLPSAPKLVHPVAIQVDEEVPGEKEHWGRGILKSYSWGVLSTEGGEFWEKKLRKKGRQEPSKEQTVLKAIIVRSCKQDEQLWVDQKTIDNISINIKIIATYSQPGTDEED